MTLILRETQDLTSQHQELYDFLQEQIEHFPDRSIRRLFQNKLNVEALVKMIEPDLATLIDFDALVPASSTFISETLREQQADLLFSVPFRSRDTSETLFIHILIEHQSTVDEMMGFRVLFYMMLIWDRYRREWENQNAPKNKRKLPPILPIVFYTGDRHWETPLALEAVMDIPAELSRFVPRFGTLFLGVKSADVETLTGKGSLLGWLLRVLQNENSDKESLSCALVEAVSFLESLDASEALQKREALVYLLMLIFHRRPVDEREELVRLVEERTSDKEISTMAETTAEFLLARGIERGARETTIENILSVLTARFPSADVNTLKPVLEAIADLNRLKQLLLNASLANSFQAFQHEL
ncbi:MAG: Rpn family recombination-promoting nuclease/putative transposase [Candidatus Poribacteria bacterium]|nr:Rpn family recombination-promoting nuclease/putative transposase [Candidatus Poribacteria bacterium]